MVGHGLAGCVMVGPQDCLLIILLGVDIRAWCLVQMVLQCDLHVMCRQVPLSAEMTTLVGRLLQPIARLEL